MVQRFQGGLRGDRSRSFVGRSNDWGDERFHRRPHASPASGRQLAVRDARTARLEAALLSAAEPISPRRLAKAAELPVTGEVRRQVARLNRMYDRTRSAFRVEELAGGYQLLTDAALRPKLNQFCHAREEMQLSAPVMETLAIVAYRQPICRADVEAIRGVQVGELLKQLLDRGLVRIAGKDDSLGRPFLYGTTKTFLRVFGLRNLHELPLVEILGRPAEDAQTAKSPAIDSQGEADEQTDDQSDDDDPPAQSDEDE